MEFNENQINRIIKIAWDNPEPFQSIQNEFGLNKGQVIGIMKQYLEKHSFKFWRRRIANGQFPKATTPILEERKIFFKPSFTDG